MTVPIRDCLFPASPPTSSLTGFGYFDFIIILITTQNLQITLFGDVRVVHADGSAPLRLSRSTQALLAYLLLQPHLVPRDVLMDVFWVDYPPDRARSSLTTAIWRLRHLLEPDGVPSGTYLIASNTSGIGFNWESHHWLDTEAFEQQIYPLVRKPVSELGEDDIQRIEGGLALYRGELLEGVYEDWALRERERFRTLYLNCLTRLMEFHASKGNFAQSIAYGHEILRVDPLREEIHRSLMRLYLESGQRTLAIRQYAQCRDLLDEELSVPPLEETQTLYQQIVASSHPGAPVSGQAPAHEIAQLMRELQRVKQSLDETARSLERIAQAVSRLAKNGEDGPMIPRKQKR